MSVQFGRCNSDGKPVDPQDLHEVHPLLAPYGPDGEGYICQANFGVIYRAFHTTKESWRETQPFVSNSGAVITWDGRLDNRQDLIENLAGELSPASTDVEIVGAAHDRWGTDAFCQLIGDWALSIWNPKDQSVVLAKDYVGIRHLYYSVENEQVTWCTILDPLVLFARHPLQLEEEYIAGWLSFFPAAHLTPYVGIRAVPPSSFVSIARSSQRITKYWDLDGAKRIRYRSDEEYEEHFRGVFSDAVRRRLRSDSPILAELSGGMDSSAIVCMADEVIIQNLAETPRLDTVSYYDDHELNWNERPYFTAVEKKRGRAGCNINVGSQQSFTFQFECGRFTAAPGDSGCTTEAGRQLAACMAANTNRVVLSGIGGDEFLGGVPSPVPELADLLVSGQLSALAGRLKAWSLNKRRPWFHVLFELLREFIPSALVNMLDHSRPAPWLQANFVARHRDAVAGYRLSLKLRGALPSFQQNLRVLDSLRNQLACESLPLEPLCEKQYPCLDRDLLEFLCAIPPEQLVRPGQRRSLMRRALAGIVPDIVLNRKRKAYVARAPLEDVSAEWTSLSRAAQDLLTNALGIVDAESLMECLQKARDGQQVPIVPLLRTVAIERWLRNLRNSGRGLFQVPPMVSQLRHAQTCADQL